MTPKHWSILFHQREYVFLAQTGISNIADEAMAHGLKAVEEFHAVCEEHNVDEIIAVGTAALRSADNSDEFTSEIRKRFEINTQVINGQKEANLIYQGMGMACPDHKKDALFMDIGGGSTEFILTNADKKVFQDSLPIGLGVLKNKLPFSDPLTVEEITRFNRFLDQQASSVIRQIKLHAPRTLIGGSGTFDVLAEALTREAFEFSNCSTIEPAQVREFINGRLHFSLAERMADASIPDSRVHLIIHAFLLILWLLDQHSFQRVAFSKYALKEGFLQEYYEGWLSEL